MRRFGSIFLALVLIGGIIATPITLVALRRSHRRETARLIAQGQWEGPLSELEFDLQNPDGMRAVVVIDHGKELLFEGRMYDVMGWKKVGTRIRVTCIRDHKEDRLLQALAEHLAAQHGNFGPLGKKPVQAFHPQYLPHPPTPTPQEEHILPFYPAGRQALAEQYRPEPLPRPPRIAA